MGFAKESIDQQMIELMEYIPELKAMYHKDHNQPAHCYDIFEHTMHVISLMPINETARLAALFHDIGKPLKETKGEDGVSHYWGHPMLSYSMAYRIMIELGYYEKQSREVANICLYHDSYGDSSYEEFVEVAKTIGFENVSILKDLQMADLKSHADWYMNKHIGQLKESHDRIDVYLAFAQADGLF